MASVKLGTLLIRTVAKPISNQIKQQAKQHETFRNICVNLAQGMYRAEAKLRTTLLGEPVKTIRPLSETKAIENGANALAEGFLFSVAASLIIAETWRSSRSSSKRREDVDDQLDDLSASVTQLVKRVDDMAARLEESWEYERHKNDELANILTRIVDVGIRGGWAQFEGTPIQLPQVQFSTPVMPLSQSESVSQLESVSSSTPPASSEASSTPSKETST